MAFVRLTDEITINASEVQSIQEDRRFYMNGSVTTLIVTMTSGKMHKFSSDWYDIGDIRKRLENAY